MDKILTHNLVYDGVKTIIERGESRSRTVQAALEPGQKLTEYVFDYELYGDYVFSEENTRKPLSPLTKVYVVSVDALSEWLGHTEYRVITLWFSQDKQVAAVAF